MISSTNRLLTLLFLITVSCHADNSSQNRLTLSIALTDGVLLLEWHNQLNDSVTLYEYTSATDRRHFDSYLIRAKNEANVESILALNGPRTASSPRFFNLPPGGKKTIKADLNFWNMLNKDYDSAYLEDGNYELWCEYIDDRWEGWHPNFVPLGPIRSNIIEVAVADGLITSKSIK